MEKIVRNVNQEKRGVRKTEMEKKCNQYKVWSGRNSKVVVAKDSSEAMKKSKYKNPDQVDKLKGKVKCPKK